MAVIGIMAAVLVLAVLIAVISIPNATSAEAAAGYAVLGALAVVLPTWAVISHMRRKVPGHVRRKIVTFDESGMGYWFVTATIRDGRRFSNVCISDRFELGFPDVCPFQAREIVDVTWDGPRRGSSAQPVPLRDEVLHEV